jgi:putative membrane protein
MLAAKLFDGVRLAGDFADALWVAACFSILSFLLSWLLFGLLGIATLGIGFIFHFITQLVAAALIVRLTSTLSSRFSVTGFVPALGTAVLLALAVELSHRIV